MSDGIKKLKLHLLEEKFTVSKLPVFQELPQIIANGEYCFAVRTDDELTVVTPDFMAPSNVQQEPGWRGIYINGQLPFQAVGLLYSLTKPLAEAGIPIFAFSTFSTDFIFIPEEVLVQAVQALQHAGHEFVHKEE
ncbi:MAG: ACT domain-containing protein [Bacteroidetes bacterium]|nr:ACT domain-containing protein [Bacteroidota bacterium]